MAYKIKQKGKVYARYEPSKEHSEWFGKTNIVKRKGKEVIVKTNDGFRLRGRILAENPDEIEVHIY